MEVTRLFRCTNQFTYLERDEPRFQGDRVSDPAVSWSGSSMFNDGPDTRFVIAANPEEAKAKFKVFIFNYPEGFCFYGKHLGNRTKRDCRDHFLKVFNEKIDEKNPKLGQHRIMVEEVDCIF